MLVVMAVLNACFPLPPIYPHGPATVVVSRDGQILRAFADQQGVRRYRISPETVTPFYLHALLHYEDRWFYVHPGINPLAIVRAAGQWMMHGRVISGGSTLTMQVARLIDPHQRSIPGKIKQAFRALQLEWTYSKTEILGFYLNLAPFGGNIQGVEAAAQHYFGKSANALTQSEAALLVVLPQKPSYYRPDRYPERAKAMRNKVLHRLAQSDLLDARSVRFLTQESLGLHMQKRPILAPLLSRHLKQAAPQADVIRTTIDHSIQQRVQRLLSLLRHQLPVKSSAAVVVVDNQRAEIIAYQGTADFADLTRFSHVDMPRATRSPGSTLKPFIYGMALDNGLIHSASLLSDIPSVFQGYKPRNLNGRFQGAISMDEALKQSLNIPLIQVFHALTPKAFDMQLAEVGIQLDHEEANLSVGLGGTGTDLLTLVSLYRSLATGGQVQPLRTIWQPEYLNPYNEAAGQTLLSPASSWIIYKTLSEITAPDRVVPTIRRQIAWKTGTSYGYRDFWSVGVSPDYTVGVWIGRPDASPVVGYLGATQAAPLMFDTFDQLPRDQRQVTRPSSVVKQVICWPGGKAKAATPADQCAIQKEAYTVRGITPPTLQTDGQFMRPSLSAITWPTQLANWQHMKGIRPAGGSDSQPVEIQHIKSGQHYFTDQLKELPLVANTDSHDLVWYVNHQPHSEPALTLNRYEGPVTVSACLEAQCDVKTIVVHGR
ncbi:penicillin-binding protein 1C [Photobacterium aphoticum]|nr:penicillin-binding protein 1C [Photobacterium aphoticum]PSU59028.1 penicillin-binding protein 1C [Photobacterium aphoticum]GHA44937.1 penicillin-binding protein 1C [Photobacterium aphoticum]